MWMIGVGGAEIGVGGAEIGVGGAEILTEWSKISQTGSEHAKVKRNDRKTRATKKFLKNVRKT